MNYPEELRERWNECMYDERDIIEKFLKDQYDLRYGRQRDTWHFEPEITMMAQNGAIIYLTDIQLDKDVFVKFFIEECDGEKKVFECCNFAYGELSKVIEALPDADEIVKKNAVNDLSEFSVNLHCDLILQESPFMYKGIKVDNVLKDDEGVHICIGELAIADEHYDADFLSKLRDHINIEVLHRSNEYKEVMQWLALEPNLRKSVDEYDKTNYGCVLFTLAGTDIEFDMSAIQRDDKGNLTIFGADTCCEDELITLTEKDIKKDYLEVILKWLTTRVDIMDTYNAHNPELVRKINDAWKKKNYHERFGAILLALLYRDKEEFENRFDCDVELTEEFAYTNANQIMEGVCDDWDLETILSFIRYKED